MTVIIKVIPVSGDPIRAYEDLGRLPDRKITGITGKDKERS
jgi:hypothetical protein